MILCATNSVTETDSKVIESTVHTRCYSNQFTHMEKHPVLFAYSVF